MQEKMKAATAQEQREEIRAELERVRQEPWSKMLERIAEGKIAEATNQFVFRVAPNDRGAALELLESELPGIFDGGTVDVRNRILSFCVKLSLDLGSFLPAWRSEDVQPPMDLARRAKGLTERFEEKDSKAARELHEQLREHLLTRLAAEKVTDPEEASSIADASMTETLGGHIESMWAEYESSNMRRAAQAYFEGKTNTTLGNDYATFLDHALRVGVCSQTTNPVLIKVAWDADATFWNGRVDEIIREEYDRDAIKRTLNSSEADRDGMIRHLNTLVTTAVVEQNCRMLRDIFLITGGHQGFVNVQVSPDNYDDADAMVSQAIALYQALGNRLGGVPNAVIKLPATPAGKLAAGELTKLGIGVTMTLTFSMFQAVELAEVLEEGNAIVSNIALMNGRLAYPVRDELAERDVPGGVEAARWGGVAVARRIYQHLYGSKAGRGKGLDPTRVQLLIASLRIYGDWLPDIEEMWGVPSITVFPNVRRAFDAHPREMRGNSIAEDTPYESIRTMFSSEIFRQAWWTPSDGDEGKPEEPLSLSAQDAEAVAAWTPVRQTLDQFIQEYRAMNEMILDRLRFLVEDK